MSKFLADIEKKKSQIEQLEKEIEDLRKKEDEALIKDIKTISRKSDKSVDELMEILKKAVQADLETNN